MGDDDLLTTEECAAILRLNTKVLYRWRANGRGPAFCKIGRLIFYRRAAIVAFIRAAERPALSTTTKRAVA